MAFTCGIHMVPLTTALVGIAVDRQLVEKEKTQSAEARCPRAVTRCFHYKTGSGGAALSAREGFCPRIPKTPLAGFDRRSPPSFIARSLRAHADASIQGGDAVAVAKPRRDEEIKVLFCGNEYPASTNYTRDYLKLYPFVKIDQVAQDEVADVIHRYDICVPKHKRLDAELIAKAVQAKLIVQFGVGLEGVDIEAATRHNIKVARIPGSSSGNSASCAEMAIYLMLGLLRKQKEMENVVKQKKLGMPMGDTLLGKTVFIMGFGDIGSDLAKRLRAFGVRILATRRSWSSSTSLSPVNASTCEADHLVDKKGGAESLYEFAAEADIVVTCLPLHSQTVGIVDRRFLSYMKKGALLVNIARGGLLDYESVYQHLKSGHLGGLAMDVAWKEPFDPQDPILKLPNVLFTPHLGGITELSYRSRAKVLGDCALRLQVGKPLVGIEFVN